ncbi:trypsin-like [Anopheles aquasalis]|uniref:trypsin-like n=1 Tax=Anopheles aquasalis TaxID=42839 RepID=UPI00215B0686|nr:trypsin-like [Anopheles aquasalis]
MYITGDFRCGGSLIGPFWVLTARHCVKDERMENIKVFVGADEAIRAQQLPVKQIYFHPELKNSEILDVALLKLPSPITYGPSVRCIEMIKSDALLVPGIPSVVSGYGDNESKDKTKEYTLKAATVTLLSTKSCQASYDYADPKYFFCAGFPQGLVDTCQGDSGGPLVLEGMLAGITIRGQGCAVAGKPGMYMKVTSVRPWIDKVLQNQTNVEEQRLCPEARKKIPTAVDVLNKTINYLIDELNEVRRINRLQQFSEP